MSLFKKNVPLQEEEEEEEVAPVMQEYTGQHPVLNFKVSAIVKSDHLDQYMEVHPFASSEPKIKVKDFNTKFGTKRNKETTKKLRSKIKITDGKIEESLNDFIQNVVSETPGIICHKTTIRESILRSSTKEVKRPSIPNYYFFPLVEGGITVSVNKGKEISNKLLEEYFYANRLQFNADYKWIVDKKVNM
jgi:hypothetical protein